MLGSRCGKSRVSSLWLGNNSIEDGDLVDSGGDIRPLSMVQLSATLRD